MRIISLDEIRERHDEMWRVNYDLFAREPSADLKRRLRAQVYNPTTCIGYGFAPLAYDDGQRPWLFARRAMCMECGHVVATQQPSWMRKHMASKHGITQRSYMSDLLSANEV